MKGSIRRRGKNSWELSIDVGRDHSGRRLREFKNVKGKKSDAEKELRELLTKKDHGLPIQGDKITVSDWTNKWLKEHVQATTRQKTQERYRDVVKNYIDPYIGHLGLQKLTPTDIKSLESEWLSKGISRQSVNYAHRILSACLKYGVRMEVLYRNPAEAVKPPRIERKEIRPPSPGIIKEILDKAEKQKVPLFPALWLISYTGIRRGECLGLEWKNVDLIENKISIVQSLVRSSDKGLILQPPKTPSSRRVVDIDGDTVRILKIHKMRQLESKVRLGPSFSDNDLVFPNNFGHPLNPMALTRSLEKAREGFGLDGMRLHDLRHLHASVLIQEGYDPLVISRRLGHSKPSMTMDIYGHLMPGRQRQAAESFANAMKAIS